MINLLPLREKIRVRSEYRLRLYAVIGAMVLVFLVSALIPLTIAYFTVSYNARFINDVTDQLSKSDGFKETGSVLNIIKSTNRKSTLLNDSMGVTVRQNILGSFSAVFEIADNTSESGTGSIKIINITYDQVAKKAPTSTSADAGTTTPAVKESGTHRISIKGFASSRESFLLFLKRLESNGNFLNVESPVNNLVNSLNIDFALTITLKDKPV